MSKPFLNNSKRHSGSNLASLHRLLQFPQMVPHLSHLLRRPRYQRWARLHQILRRILNSLRCYFRSYGQTRWLVKRKTGSRWSRWPCFVLWDRGKQHRVQVVCIQCQDRPAGPRLSSGLRDWLVVHRWSCGGFGFGWSGEEIRCGMAANVSDNGRSCTGKLVVLFLVRNLFL